MLLIPILSVFKKIDNSKSMDESNLSKKNIMKTASYPIWLTRAVATVLVPSYIFTTCVESYANVPTVTAAEVESVYNPSQNIYDQLTMGSPDSREREPAIRGLQLKDLSQLLFVPGNNKSWGLLQYLSISGHKFGPGVEAGPADSPTKYYFPCTLVGGSSIVGWEQGDTDRGCVPPGITVRRNRGDSSAQLLDQSNILTSQVLKNLFKAQAFQNQQFRYCTVAARGRGWWLRWGTFDDPCQEANQECLKTGPADGCQVVSLGDWHVRDRDLFVSVECANDQIFTHEGNDGLEVATSLISDLAQEAKDNGSKACALNIYQPDKLIVIPATEQATLIQTHDFSNTLVIDALAGDIIIKSAKHPVGLLLKVGNRYTYPEDNAQPINVLEIAKSPPVQSFLDPTNWSQDAAAKLDEYRKVIGRSEPVPNPQPDRPPPRRKETPEKLIPSIIFGIFHLLPNSGPSPSSRNR